MENEARFKRSKVNIFGATVTSPTPVIILKASIASRHPIKFGVGPIAGGTPEVTFESASKTSGVNSFPFEGKLNISS